MDFLHVHGRFEQPKAIDAYGCGHKQQWANDYSSGGGWPGRLLGRDSVVIDKLTNYVSRSALIAATAHCIRQDAIHKECLSASRRVCGRANAASTQAGYILLLGQGVEGDSQDTSYGFDR